MQLTKDMAETILAKHSNEPSLVKHAIAVSAAMGAMAEYFGEDKAHWEAIGYLHDVDYEQFPDEHLQHTREKLEPEGLDEADIRAILSHGWGICTDQKPETNLEKSLYTVDELTGIVMAAARMRPNGISDLSVSSLKKKYKDKKFAAKCDRAVIQSGCELLGLPLETVMEQTIRGMQTKANELELLGLAQ
ncbi:MAG: HDIG domain-containing protein [Clostridia bacterium]|nr:HDIG domain-containing protein [Clostridia bacterium]MBR3271696.1 HDIG domain-containing protein [Clostridia bacterium]